MFGQGSQGGWVGLATFGDFWHMGATKSNGAFGNDVIVIPTWLKVFGCICIFFSVRLLKGSKG